MNVMQRSNRARKMRGVTLIELMIVVVVIGILVAIAYPGYQGQIQRTRRADGKATMLETAQRLERCFTRYNSYADAGCDIAASLMGGITTPEGWYVITDSYAGPSTFTLVATPQGAQVNDANCGALSLTHRSERNAAGPEGPACW